MESCTELNIDLVYDHDCPNVSDCRHALRLALTQFGSHLSWNEWDRNSAETPAAYRSFGSPTVLVNGRDVYALTGEPEGNSCRIYLDGDSGSLSGMPSVQSIVNALNAATTDTTVTQTGTHAARSHAGANGGCAC